LALAGLGAIGYILYRNLESPLPTPPAATNRSLVAAEVTRRTGRPLAADVGSLGSWRPSTAGQPGPDLSTPRLALTNPALPTAQGEVPSPALTNVLPPRPPPIPVPSPPPDGPRPVQDLLEAQIALARQGISSGSIDGANGYQTRAAVRAFQVRERLPQSGALDATTRTRLRLEFPAFTNYVVASNDVARLSPVPSTWLGKSRQPRLDYATLLELVAERHRAHPSLLRRLNPDVSWTNLVTGQWLTVPFVPPPVLPARLAFLRIRLQDRILSGYDLRTNLLLHFPCSIASRVEKRPLGRLEVVVIARDPAYTFNPAVFPESAEGRRLGRKLTIPPGPNNPVGVAWIGLSRPGYGIHGTPRPEDVGRTESHGCFRLANWDAEVLVQLVWRGLPVYVQY
jgi:hypothetical protein